MNNLTANGQLVRIAGLVEWVLKEIARASWSRLEEHF